MIIRLPSPKQASRVVRTVHQVLVAALVTLPGVVVALDLDVPADKVLAVSGVLAAVAGAVAKVYNLIFPAEPDLDETPQA